MTKPESLEPGVVCDLALYEQELRRGDPYQREGHAARTLVRENDLRVLLIPMRAGTRIAEHLAEATVMIHLLAGQVRVHVSGAGARDVTLEPGRVLVLEAGAPHDVEAVVESTLLLTLGWRPRAHLPQT